jgi:hypothetical protein
MLNCSTNLFAQGYEVPKNYKFETAEDIKSFHTDVVKAIEWLENTPIDNHKDKRREANAFVLAWLTVTPSVKVNLQSYVTVLSKKNPSLLMSFLGGWARYSLENPDQIKNDLANNKKGTESILKVYSNNLSSGIKKDKKIENLIKMDSNELEEWLKSNMN